MSETDHDVIKRVVRSVLAKTLALRDEQTAQIANAVHTELTHECGGDRLYVPVPARLADRDERIRASFRVLSAAHSARLAYEMLSRREALSVKQLRRICADE